MISLLLLFGPLLAAYLLYLWAEHTDLISHQKHATAAHKGWQTRKQTGHTAQLKRELDTDLSIIDSLIAYEKPTDAIRDRVERLNDRIAAIIAELEAKEV